MKVELTKNIVAVIRDCAYTLTDRTGMEPPTAVETICEWCPLRNACLEVLTGDDTENK